MKKILLTNPPWITKDDFLSQRWGVRAGSRWPFTMHYWNILRYLPRRFGFYCPYPMFMGYATTYLQSKGIEAKFYDAIAWRHDYDQFLREVDKFNPDIVIQETSTPSFPVDLEIAKKLHRNAEVCLVGPHATAFAQKLIKLPFVDYILKGEYELSSLRMIKTKRKGVYEPERVADLDSLPYPYRDKEIIGFYSEPCCQRKLSYPQLWVYAGRGCAFSCEFCLWVHTMYSKRFTLRKPEKVIAEIENAISKYGIKYILFDDDCWNLGGDKRLMEMADGLKKLKLPWSVLARMDTCSKDTFKYLVDRGCAGIRLGVESLSQRLLDRVEKKLTVKKIMETIKFLRRLDVDLYLCFVHYIPGETEQERREQDENIKKLGIKYQNPPLIPFPGTPYYQQLVENGFDPEKKVKWEEYDGGHLGKNLERLIEKYSSQKK